MSNESFDSGAKRGSQVGKGRYDLVSPVATKALAQVLESGANKYGDRNWEKGIPIMRHMSSAKRHIDQFIMGETHELNDAGELVEVNHLHNAYANLMMAIHTLWMVENGLLSDTIDDRPLYGRPYLADDLLGTEAPLEWDVMHDVRFDAHPYEYYVVEGFPDCKNENGPYGLLRVDRRSPQDPKSWEWASNYTEWTNEFYEMYNVGEFLTYEEAEKAMKKRCEGHPWELINYKELPRNVFPL